MLHPDLKTIIIMGVSGSGKSVVGSLLAAKLDGVFEDGDDFHPPANKAKIEGMGLQATFVGGEDLAALIQRDSETWGNVIKAAHIKVEQ